MTCQLDYLGSLPTDAAKRKALGSLPPTLHETYERILDNITESGIENQEIVGSLLRWLIYAQERLNTRDLCYAASMKEGDLEMDPEAVVKEETLLWCCSSLIRESSNTGRIELAHFTVSLRDPIIFEDIVLGHEHGSD